MTIKERFGLVTLTLAAAFAGGSVSGHIFAARAVDAANAPRMITAQKFMLVDSHGKTRGEFNVTSKGVAQIAVFDGTGTLRAGLGVGLRRRPRTRHLRSRRQAARRSRPHQQRRANRPLRRQRDRPSLSRRRPRRPIRPRPDG